MADAKSLLHLDLDSEVFFSHSVDVDITVSQEMRITCQKTMEGPRVTIVPATKVILVFSLMA